MILTSSPFYAHSAHKQMLIYDKKYPKYFAMELSR